MAYNDLVFERLAEAVSIRCIHFLSPKTILTNNEARFSRDWEWCAFLFLLYKEGNTKLVIGIKRPPLVRHKNESTARQSRWKKLRRYMLSAPAMRNNHYNHFKHSFYLLKKARYNANRILWKGNNHDPSGVRRDADIAVKISGLL